MTIKINDVIEELSSTIGKQTTANKSCKVFEIESFNNNQRDGSKTTRHKQMIQKLSLSNLN